MTLSSAIDTARLSVLLDIRYPHAYLALHPARAAVLCAARDLHSGTRAPWLLESLLQ